MTAQPGFFDLDERCAALPARGEPLARLGELVDFELFRPTPEAALPRADRSKGGRPPHGPVLMLELLPLQTLDNRSDERTEFPIKDRLSFVRFVGLGPGDPVPDATTLWLFREQLTRAGAIAALFARFDAARRWRGRPSTPRSSRRRPAGTGSRLAIAVPVFGYKNHVSTDRRYGLIRTRTVSDAAEHDRRRFRELSDRSNTAVRWGQVRPTARPGTSAIWPPTA